MSCTVGPIERARSRVGFYRPTDWSSRAVVPPSMCSNNGGGRGIGTPKDLAARWIQVRTARPVTMSSAVLIVTYHALTRLARATESIVTTNAEERHGLVPRTDLLY